jgi:DNA-binding NtrC family response regulator
MSQETERDREALIVEDEPNLRELISDLLRADRISVEAVGTVEEAEALLGRRAPDLLVLDVKLPDGDGLELLGRMRRQGLRTPVLVITAFGTLERAVQALRAGAHDFLVKPFDNQRLRAAAASALEAGARLEELELEAATLEGSTEVGREIIGASGGLRDVIGLLPRVAASEATVLIRGESGTGKELIARAIHAASPRLDGPFVSLNCAAIAPSLLESELFGFERGAFTGAHARRKGHVEVADGGTLFLDEIGDMSLEAQARLLRVLQEREITRVGGRTPVPVDVRVIAATHRDLAERVREGAFREDLLYRLDVMRIGLPPLRERREDIPGLVAHLLEKSGRKHGASALPELTPAILSALKAHTWPGNVRELENTVERAVVLGSFELSGLGPGPGAASPSVVRAEPMRAEPGHAALGDAREPVRALREVVAEAERRAVVAALRQAAGNKAEAARLLGVSYKTLFNKIHEHGIKEELSIG